VARYRRDQLHRVKPGRHDQVRRREQVPDRPVPGHVQRPRVPRAVLGEHALGHRPDDDVQPRVLRELREHGLRTAAHRAGPDQQHRPPGGTQQAQGLAPGGARTGIRGEKFEAGPG